MEKKNISALVLAATMCAGASLAHAHDAVVAVPVDRLKGVETVTMASADGPVVVVSFPVSGNVAESNYNIDFSLVDTDGDGYISRTEAKAVAGRNDATANLAEQFAAADVTDDNRLGFFEIIDWVY